MEVILSKQCVSLTGMLERGLGYSLQRRGKRFFSQRSKYPVPPDGHWRFIVLCAEIAQNGLYVTDIKVGWLELQGALYEAKCFIAMQNLRKDTYNARDVLNLKITFSL